MVVLRKASMHAKSNEYWAYQSLIDFSLHDLREIFLCSLELEFVFSKMATAVSIDLAQFYHRCQVQFSIFKSFSLSFVEGIPESEYWNHFQ